MAGRRLVSLMNLKSTVSSAEIEVGYFVDRFSAAYFGRGKVLLAVDISTWALATVSGNFP